MEGERMKKILLYGVLLLIPVLVVSMFCGIYALGILIYFGFVFHAAVGYASRERTEEAAVPSAADGNETRD